jgi:hypothetical protein
VVLDLDVCCLSLFDFIFKPVENVIKIIQFVVYFISWCLIKYFFEQLRRTSFFLVNLIIFLFTKNLGFTNSRQIIISSLRFHQLPLTLSIAQTIFIDHHQTYRTLFHFFELLVTFNMLVYWIISR